MKALLAVLGILAVTAITVTPAAAQGNNCFPGSGIGVGGNPGDRFSGTFPGGGATGGVFPGGTCGSNHVGAAEPITMTLAAAGLAAASCLRRRRPK